MASWSGFEGYGVEEGRASGLGQAGWTTHGRGFQDIEMSSGRGVVGFEFLLMLSRRRPGSAAHHDRASASRSRSTASRTRSSSSPVSSSGEGGSGVEARDTRRVGDDPQGNGQRQRHVCARDCCTAVLRRPRAAMGFVFVRPAPGGSHPLRDLHVRLVEEESEHLWCCSYRTTCSWAACLRKPMSPNLRW